MLVLSDKLSHNIGDAQDQGADFQVENGTVNQVQAGSKGMGTLHCLSQTSLTSAPVQFPCTRS